MEPTTTSHRLSMGTTSIVLGIAGLLPILPFVGSVAALACGVGSQSDAEDAQRGRIGIVLGILGIAAPLLFLFVYCVVLGYPWPIHRYRPDQ